MDRFNDLADCPSLELDEIILGRVTYLSLDRSGTSLRTLPRVDTS